MVANRALLRVLDSADFRKVLKAAVLPMASPQPRCRPKPAFLNPLNPKRYVVLNSGFTFREDNASNARQTPKLPDWAIVDITVPPSPLRVGRVVNAGFFGEQWELK